MIHFIADLLISGSLITLQPTTEPGAIAEVVFENHSSNGPHDSGQYSLAMDSLQIGIWFIWDAAVTDDRITVTPPDGVMCQPSDCTLTLEEGAVGKIILFDFVGF